MILLLTVILQLMNSNADNSITVDNSIKCNVVISMQSGCIMRVYLMS